jgi:hypothetical protein
VKFPANIQCEAAGGRIAARSRVTVKTVLIGTAVIVNDGRAQVKAVTQRGPAHAARHGINRFNSGVALVRPTRARHVESHFVRQRFVNFLGLVCFGCRIGIFNARGYILEHATNAGTGPRAHTEIDMIDKSQSIKPKDCRIDPIVHGNKRRSESGWFANRSRRPALGSRCLFGFACIWVRPRLRFEHRWLR